MSAEQVAILAVVAIVVNLFKRGRSLVLLVVSAFVVYWLQPIQNPINLTFWFPTLTLIVTVGSWLLTSVPEKRTWRENFGAIAVLSFVVLFFDLNRYFKLEGLFVTDTPRIQLAVVMILAVVAVCFLLARIKHFPAFILLLAIVGIVAILVFLKLPSALTGLIETVAGLRGKDGGEASAISWLGFSYIAFRLMHTILDRKAGRLPAVSLAEYVNYAIFFPAFTAGPIERIERFIGNLNAPHTMNRDGWLDAGTRLFAGLFKKFVIADSLAWFALSDGFAQYVHSAGWMWVLLYAYSLRIYFDFSGYTDIAIGLARLMGIRLPENFNAPYLKPNLTQFWNSWHMTLTQWFRAYFFNPLTRLMRSTKWQMPQVLMILLAQVSTMVLIGLWHGMTLSFLFWGLWHGVGLFIHNRWSDWMRARTPEWSKTGWGAVAWNYAGIFLTFQYVTLGWLFFCLSTPTLAWSALLKLLGVA
jgi:alginate O-acetyltransferase complex protein AlgI